MKRISDEELIAAIHEGKQHLIQVLYQRYDKHAKHVAYELASRIRNSGVTVEDIFTVAFESTAKALKHYDASKNVAFYAYWRGIADNDINSYLRENAYSGNNSFLRGISLDEDPSTDHVCNAEKYGLNDSFQSEGDLADEIIKMVRDPGNNFKKREQQVIAGLLGGLSAAEVCSYIGINYSTYYYHLESAKKKLKKLLKY